LKNGAHSQKDLRYAIISLCPPLFLAYLFHYPTSQGIGQNECSTASVSPLNQINQVPGAAPCRTAMWLQPTRLVSWSSQGKWMEMWVRYPSSNGFSWNIE
jgi:hypothetical protein